MSTYLWKYYLQDDLDDFRQLLASANYIGTQYKPNATSNGAGATIGSPGRGLSTSPNLRNKSKTQGSLGAHGRTGRTSGGIVLSRADINAKDRHGVTLLHHMASSKAESASEFALSLLEVPLLDIYIQDLESGWTALHRALYNGNVTIAYALMERDIRDGMAAGGSHQSGGLIKIKDNEGSSPFDVYASTIAPRTLKRDSAHESLPMLPQDVDERSVSSDEEHQQHQVELNGRLDGDEMYSFGSNKASLHVLACVAV